MYSEIKLKSNAKINLFLDILNKREDGYHNIKSVMQSVSLYDEITISKTASDISISCTDDKIPLDERNTCYKAAKIIKDKYNITTGVHIHINKSIPSEAGLAGGSGNCAAVIRGMDKLFEIGMTEKEMLEVGVSIGADVPFCLTGGTVLCEGIGEKMTTLKPFEWENILIIKPDFSVSTKAAYEGLSKDDYHLFEENKIVEYINQKSSMKVAKSVANTLEISISKLYKEVDEIKRAMTDSGAVSALMTGSGSAIFGLYKSKADSQNAYNKLKHLYNNVYLVKTAKEGVKWS